MPDSLDNMLTYRLSPRAAMVLTSALLLFGAIVEFALVPANVVVPILYPIAVAVCLWTRSIRMLWSTAMIAAVLGMCIHRFAIRPPLMDMSYVILINRLAAVATTFVVAIFVDRGIRTHHFAETQFGTLGERNLALERLNLELGQREEEIVRQNEELQSQTEELERQTEELRVTNEELVSWERRLEQLLELSRSLTADTKRSAVFSKVCEALGSLVESHATTLFLREGDVLRIHCHHGFGTEGPQHLAIPYTGSFSSQVMLLGQTGYVEDIRLRPDLQIAQPKRGPEFRAVLATPLRIDGRIIGTIEAYFPGNRTWTASEVAIIESLAVQAGKSIQEAELMETIRLERRRFEAALRTVPIGIAVSDDASGDRVRMNGTAAAMFELPTDENISLTTPAGMRLASRLIHLNQPADTHRLPLSRALRGEEVFSAEFEFRSPKGRRSALLISAAPILDEDQNVAGAVSAFIDVTEHKSLARELELRRREAEEASLRKTRFLAAVSHDIRTPANAVNLMAEIIRRLAGDPSRSAEIAEMTQRLQANIHVLMELIGDLLDISRFDTGKMELTMTEFPLADLLEQEVGQVTPLARDKRLELTIEPMSRAIWVRSDRVKLGRVLGNLLGNAIKFTERGTIVLSANVATDSSQRILLRVQDSGIGISPEDLETIFDEFSQLHNPARDRTKGSGLGLAICKRIVELLGGSITVESKLSCGSTFTVELPGSTIVLRTEHSQRIISDKVLDSRPSEPINLRILLIEDHTPTRDGTAHLLREEGAIISEAPDGQTGLRLLRDESFDVVLLDMMLPDLDGREILRALQQDRPATLRGILVLTGDLTDDRVNEIKSLGGDGLISKPIELPKLLQMLRSFASLD